MCKWVFCFAEVGRIDSISRQFNTKETERKRCNVRPSKIQFFGLIELWKFLGFRNLFSQKVPKCLERPQNNQLCLQAKNSGVAPNLLTVSKTHKSCENSSIFDCEVRSMAVLRMNLLLLLLGVWIFNS